MPGWLALAPSRAGHAPSHGLCHGPCHVRRVHTLRRRASPDALEQCLQVVRVLIGHGLPLELHRLRQRAPVDAERRLHGLRGGEHLPDAPVGPRVVHALHFCQRDVVQFRLSQFPDVPVVTALLQAGLPATQRALADNEGVL